MGNKLQGYGGPYPENHPSFRWCTACNSRQPFQYLEGKVRRFLPHHAHVETYNKTRIVLCPASAVRVQDADVPINPISEAT